MTHSPVLVLNDGRELPQVGLGVWQIPDEDTSRVVSEAIGLGYRLIDGAALYHNEKGLGEGVRRAEVPREEIFVTTKVWNDRQGFDNTLRAVEESLGRLGMERVDLLLIHWPAASRGLYVETWKALIRLREEGRATSIGVSNFLPEHLDRIVGETGVVPALNQIELHPELPQRELRAKHAEMGIATQGWTPLGEGRTFGHPVVQRIAERTGASPAQVVLAWSVGLGCAPIPRSTKAERLAENLASHLVQLEPEEFDAMDALETGHRCGPDPRHFA
jgi:2,5-diketo-D-gluconate reductase A